MFADHQIQIQEFDSRYAPVHYACTNNEGGLFLENPDPEAQRGMLDMVKKMTSKILGGASLLELTLPAHMLYKGSHAEIIADDFSILAAYATEAAKIADPVERLAMITAGFIGGLTTQSRIINAAPPIKMMIGETFSSVLENGCTLYVEQAGPLRSDTLVQIYGPDECFRLHCHYRIKLKMKGINPNTMTGHKDSPVFIFFKDGQNYELNFPK